MKGQGLSITTIVVAAIALLVLVVLVAVFTGNIGKTNVGLASCQAAGGECLAGDTQEGYIRNTLKDPSCATEGPTDSRCWVRLKGI